MLKENTNMDGGFKRLDWLYLSIMIVITLSVYHNSVHGPFIYDDLEAIVSNPAIHEGLQNPGKILQLSHGTLAGRPLTSFTFAMNYYFHQLKVEPYHLTNLLIHLCNGVLVFLILRFILRGSKINEVLRQNSSKLAFSIALIWSIHPLLTESVNYIVQRTELLMTFFFLWSFFLAILAFERKGPKSFILCALSVFACLCGVCSKEVAAVIPIVVFCYDWVHSDLSLKRILRLRWGFYILLAGSWILSFFLIAHGQLKTNTSGLNVSMSPWLYCKTQASVIIHYLKLCFFPSGLVIDYGDWPLAEHLQSVLPQAIIILGLVITSAYLLCIRKSFIGFLGCSFFIILAPTSSFVPIVTELVAERRMYLPTLLVITLSVCAFHWAIQKICKKRSLRLALAILTILLVVVSFSILTWQRNKLYQSDLTIWTDAVSKRPENPRAHVWLGFSYASRGNLILASFHFNEAIRLQPDNEYAHNSLGDLLILEGKDAEAEKHYSEVTRIRPSFAKPYFKIGTILMRRGDVRSAINYFKECLKRDPADVECKTQLENAAIIQLRRVLSGKNES